MQITNVPGIYLGFDPTSGFHKVGMSVDVKTRVASYGNQFDLIHVVPYEREYLRRAEKEWLDFFGAPAAGNEWYHLSDSDIEFFKSCRSNEWPNGDTTEEVAKRAEEVARAERKARDAGIDLNLAFRSEAMNDDLSEAEAVARVVRIWYTTGCENEALSAAIRSLVGTFGMQLYLLDERISSGATVTPGG